MTVLMKLNDVCHADAVLLIHLWVWPYSTTLTSCHPAATTFKQLTSDVAVLMTQPQYQWSNMLRPHRIQHICAHQLIHFNNIQWQTLFTARNMTVGKHNHYHSALWPNITATSPQSSTLITHLIWPNISTMSKRVKQTSYHNCNNSYCLLVLSYIKRVCHKKQSKWLNSQTLSFFVKHIYSICHFYKYHFWFWSKLFLVGYTYSELKVLFSCKKWRFLDLAVPTHTLEF